MPVVYTWIRERAYAVQMQAGTNLIILVRYQRVANAADAPRTLAPQDGWVIPETPRKF